MKKNKIFFNKGFTLIELLVVIAIIGILATIVLISLGSGRNKANDSSVQRSLGQIRTQSGLYYEANGYSFGNFPLNSCPTTAGVGSMFLDQKVIDLVKDANRNAGDAVPGGPSRCVATPTNWAISAQMKTSTVSSPKFWCVDSNGKGKQQNAHIAGTSCQ